MKYSNELKKIFKLLLFILYQFSLDADTIFLKNGQKIIGKIINQTRENVELQKEDGTKIVVNKENIQKIEFGPSQKEIEDKKRLEEERRRKEEERKRFEEEQRRKEEERRRILEEQQKREEERRRAEEEKLKKEEEKKRTQIKVRPFEKRQGFEVGYGAGPAYVVPSFFKIYDSFFNFLFPFSLSGLFLSYNYESFSQQLFIRYYKNDFEAGFSVSSFQIDSSNFKNKLRVGVGYQRNQYLSSIFPFSNNVSDAKNNYINIWLIYNLTYFHLFNNKTIFGVETNVYQIKLNTKQRFFTLTGGGSVIDFINFNSNNNKHLSIGPLIKMYLNPKNYLSLNLLISSGGIKPKIEYQLFNSISTFNIINSFDVFIANISEMKSNGIYTSFQWNTSIYKDLNFFVKYAFNENHYKINKINVENYRVFSTSSTVESLVQSIPGFFLSRDKKQRRVIEKNQYLNLGVVYYFNFF